MHRFSLLLVALLFTSCTTAESIKEPLTHPAVASSLAPLPKGNFTFSADGNASGTVFVRGYATQERVKDGACEKDCRYDIYVSLTITDASDGDFLTYLKSNHGNFYADDHHVGLGCRDGDLISFSNDTDASGRVRQTLTTETSKAILSSTWWRLVTLKLTKAPLTKWSGTPTCYSHLSSVSLVDTVQ